MTQASAFSGSSCAGGGLSPSSGTTASAKPAPPSCASLMTILWQHLAGCEGCYHGWVQAWSASAAQRSSPTATEAIGTSSDILGQLFSIDNSSFNRQIDQAILQRQAPSSRCQTGPTVEKSSSSKRVRRPIRRKRSGK